MSILISQRLLQQSISENAIFSLHNVSLPPKITLREIHLRPIGRVKRMQLDERYQRFESGWSGGGNEGRWGGGN